MSAFMIWVAAPIVIGLVLFALRRYYLLTVSLGTISCAFLAVAALILPLDSEIQVGKFVIFIPSAISLFGRQFVFTPQDRPLHVVVYLLSSFWFFAVYWAKAGRMIVPLGMIVVALLIAALAVEPFLYAGLIIALAVLVCIPILAPPGKPVQRGVLRFLTSLSLGVPFILFTGWILVGVESRPGDIDLINRSAGLLALGFVFLIGIFPFHTWVLMLSEDTHPYAAGFVFVVLPWMTSLFGLGFLDHYPWLRSEQFLLIIRWIGVVMVMVAGVWAAFEIHLGRLFGYAALVETGLILTSASLADNQGMLFELGVPRTVSLAVWALALSVLRRKVPDLKFGSVAGVGRSFPVVGSALIMAQFSVAGVPLLAGFPLRLSIWNSVAEVDLLAALALLAGSFGLMASGLRVLTVLVTGSQEKPWSISETPDVLILLGVAVSFLLFYGVFPQLIAQPLYDALQLLP